MSLRDMNVDNGPILDEHLFRSAFSKKGLIFEGEWSNFSIKKRPKISDAAAT